MISRTLSQMAAQTFIPWLSSLGLLIFLSVFIGALIWVYRRGSAEVYQGLSRLPLESEPKPRHEVRS
jgi:cbb3-type cytochrome oxidase subunit 3